MKSQKSRLTTAQSCSPTVWCRQRKPSSAFSAPQRTHRLVIIPAPFHPLESITSPGQEPFHVEPREASADPAVTCGERLQEALPVEALDFRGELAHDRADDGSDAPRAGRRAS